jgi:hypothetical protein
MYCAAVSVLRAELYFAASFDECCCCPSLWLFFLKNRKSFSIDLTHLLGINTHSSQAKVRERGRELDVDGIGFGC